jgi:hypothetical protein
MGRCSSVVEHILKHFKTLGSISSTKKLFRVRRKEIMPFVTAQMSLEDKMLSDRRQT